MLGNIGSTEIIVILVILVVLFGAQRMTQVARGLGESTKELKKAKREYESDINTIVTESKEKPHSTNEDTSVV